MIIQVNKNWRIESDSMNWIVQKYAPGSKAEKHKWRNMGYYLDFANALKHLTELRIRLIDSSIPEEILAAVAEIKQQAKNAALVHTE